MIGAIIGKMAFGGFGRNIFNPAIVGSSLALLRQKGLPDGQMFQEKLE